MSGNEAVDFSLIEGHKENIQPLASGRSARALASVLTPTTGSTPQNTRIVASAARASFEKELATASELDDPLEVWERYFRWTLDNFPAGQSAESGIVSLLERVTKEFLREPQYKNDPRYLKMWVHYIQNFSDAPREHFAYLARHDIGQRLALYYEEFAAYLESIDRRNQAGEIYRSGIENNARPVDRLIRKYEEFMQRLEANPPRADEPASPAIPTVRPALASKSLPFGETSGSSGSPVNPQASQGIPSAIKKPAKKKLAVFSDADVEPSHKDTSAAGPVGWENIGSLDHRKKENAQEPRPWAGETLKQAGTTKKKEKLTIFRDTSSSSAAAQTNTEKRNERVAADLESVYPDPSDPNEEYSFEELRAMSRGLYGIDWRRLRADEEEERARQQVRKQRRPMEGSHTPVKVKTVLSPSPNKKKVKRLRQTSSPTMTFHSKAATDEIYDMFSQPFIGRIPGEPVHEEAGDIDLSDDDFTKTEFTMTDYGQRGKSRADSGNDSDHSQWSEFEEENVVTGSNSHQENQENAVQKGFEKLQIYRENDENGSPPRSSQPGRKLEIPPPPEDFDPPTGRYRDAIEAQNSRLPFMTPITELTESLPPTTHRRNRQSLKTPCRTASSDGSFVSSPFEEEVPEPTMPFNPLPSLQEIVRERAGNDDEDIALEESPHKPSKPAKLIVFEDKENEPVEAPKLKEVRPTSKPLVDPSARGKPIIMDLQVCPTDDGVRAEILDKVQPPLHTYDGFNCYPGRKYGKADAIKRFAKAMAKKNSEKTMSIPEAPYLDFPNCKTTYYLRKELGKGTFAPVYLVENSLLDEEATGFDAEDGLVTKMRNSGRCHLEALKMEHPPNAWEYYIIATAKRRLGLSRAADSIVSAHELHLFDDECFLIIDYLYQGTLVDLVNLARNDMTAGNKDGLDETLVMFLSIELLRTVEGLHSKGIVHGDLKADNCLVRFEQIPEPSWGIRYRADGSDGWDKKGMTLIDFGRGIDMRAFQPEAQFVADWVPDNQDCPEIKEMRPWTYQIDYHGAAGVIHTMLFGKYIETVVDRNDSILGGRAKRYKLATSLRRYWQTEIWNEVFDVLLNPLSHAPDGKLPVTNALKACRLKMEEWLENNSEKGTGLKFLIRKMEGAIGKKR